MHMARGDRRGAGGTRADTGGTSPDTARADTGGTSPDTGPPPESDADRIIREEAEAEAEAVMVRAAAEARREAEAEARSTVAMEMGEGVLGTTNKGNTALFGSLVESAKNPWATFKSLFWFDKGVRGASAAAGNFMDKSFGVVQGWMNWVVNTAIAPSAKLMGFMKPKEVVQTPLYKDYKDDSKPASTKK